MTIHIMDYGAPPTWAGPADDKEPTAPDFKPEIFFGNILITH